MSFDIVKFFEEEEKKKSEFKGRLTKENGVENNPKLDRLFEIAWDFGHSSGFNEVDIYFSEMVDLIK